MKKIGDLLANFFAGANTWVVGVVTAIISILLLRNVRSESKRKKAENEKNKAVQERDFLEIEKDVANTDLDDLIDEHSDEQRKRDRW